MAYLGPAPQTETRGRGRIWNSCEEAQKTKKIENRSLTSLQQRLVKTGGRLIKHARCYWLTLAESHLTRRVVREHGPAGRCAGGGDEVARGQ